MRRPVEFTPWVVDGASIVWILLGGALLILAIYLATRGGRERPEVRHTPGHPPLRTYAGILKTDAHPMPVFIILFSVLALLWAIWYILRIGALGLYY